MRALRCNNAATTGPIYISRAPGPRRTGGGRHAAGPDRRPDDLPAEGACPRAQSGNAVEWFAPARIMWFWNLDRANVYRAAGIIFTRILFTSFAVGARCG